MTEIQDSRNMQKYVSLWSFGRGANGIYALLGFNATQTGSSVPKCRYGVTIIRYEVTIIRCEVTIIRHEVTIIRCAKFQNTTDLIQRYNYTKHTILLRQTQHSLMIVVFEQYCIFCIRVERFGMANIKKRDIISLILVINQLNAKILVL